jgi:hypothetical protein
MIGFEQLILGLLLVTTQESIKREIPVVVCFIDGKAVDLPRLLENLSLGCRRHSSGLTKSDLC